MSSFVAIRKDSRVDFARVKCGSNRRMLRLGTRTFPSTLPQAHLQFTARKRVHEALHDGEKCESVAISARR